MFTLNNKEFNYPTLCISIIDNYLVFTTKKNGSRYFEDLSHDFINPSQVNTINLRLHNSENWFSDEMYNFSKFTFEVSSNTLIDEHIFLKILGIDTFGELFSDKVFEKFKFIFVVRNPMERFFTGFFEVIDSILGVLQLDSHNLHTFEIIKNYFNINDYNSLNNLSQDRINFILNQYTQSITENIFNDEHLSLWNYFLLEFLENENLLNKINIIDLNDTNSMSIFNQVSQPSNKPWLNGWLTDEKNKIHIDNLLLKFKNYFDLEIEAYNTLLGKNG